METRVINMSGAALPCIRSAAVVGRWSSLAATSGVSPVREHLRRASHPGSVRVAVLPAASTRDLVGPDVTSDFAVFTGPADVPLPRSKRGT